MSGIGILAAGCTKIGYEIHVFGILGSALLRPSHVQCLYMCTKFPFRVNIFPLRNALLFRKIAWTPFYKRTVPSIIPVQSGQSQLILLLK